MNKQLIEKVYSSESQFSLAITGGGTSAIADLFAVAGASSTLLEATVPYHATSLNRFVSATRPQSCNTHTARAMAMAAYSSARSIKPDHAIGLGCTAAIATNRDRKGADRCHIAIQSATFTTCFDILLDKRDSRQEQESICREAILIAMADAAGVPAPEMPGDTKKQQVVAEMPWVELLAGKISSTATPDNPCLFPGAFNPIHDGHREIINLAREVTGRDITLELSIRNVDKPPLDFLTMAERYTDEYDLVFTNAPTFVEKSAIFPESIFVVGVDTIQRIDEPRYYDSQAGRDAALTTMADRGIQFLVFGREADNRFLTLSDLALSPKLRDLCTEVTEDQFRHDISSSEIRSR